MSTASPTQSYRNVSPLLPMSFQTLATLAGALIFRDGPKITGVASLEDALPGDLSFYTDKRYAPQLKATKASVLILANPMPELNVGQLIHPEPLLAFSRVLEHLFPVPAPAATIHPTAIIDPQALVEADVAIGPHCVIEAHARIGRGSRLSAGCFVGAHASLGADCLLDVGVKVLHHSRLGARVRVQAGSVIGSDGFGYRWNGQAHQRIAQVGIVDIGDDVEIGAGCTIDRAMLGATVIGTGSRLDNLVHIGHNVKVGEHCLLVAQVGISGSSRLGKGVVLAGQVGVADHSVIEDQAVVVAQSGIHGRIGAGETVAGTPNMPHAQWRKVSAALPYLPDMLSHMRRTRRAMASASDPMFLGWDELDSEE